MEVGCHKQKVFITGASRGIGRAIKQGFIDEGAIVISPTREEMNLSDRQSVTQYLDANFDEDISIFVFCAGINPKNLCEETEISDIDEAFQVNLISAIQILKKYIPVLKAKKRGKIVFITSLYAAVTREGRVPYTSSKHAATGLMKTLAVELAPYGVCVNAVAPGYVMTEMTRKNLNEQEMKEIKAMIPTGRFQKPEEIADAVLFLCSERNSSITGQTISVDGGFLCK